MLFVFSGYIIVEDILDAQVPTCPTEYINTKYEGTYAEDEDILIRRSLHSQDTGHSPNAPRKQVSGLLSFYNNYYYYYFVITIIITYNVIIIIL